jgi:hypothetical protein
MTELDNSTPPTPPAASPSTRSTPKFVVGIVMTVLGGLWLLGGLARFTAGLAASSNGAEAAGRVVGGLLIPVIILVVGIVLLATSRRKA